jgi:leucyl-tRNA synthetase
MASLSCNTAIAKLIELNNVLTGLEETPREVASGLVKMLAPLAPHVAEELWRLLGGTSTIVFEPFPTAEARYLVDSLVEVPVLIQKKVVTRIEVPPGTSAADLEKAALASSKVQEKLAGRKVLRVIAVPDRTVNLVVG